MPEQWTRTIHSLAPVRGLTRPSNPSPFHWCEEKCPETSCQKPWIFLLFLMTWILVYNRRHNLFLLKIDDVNQSARRGTTDKIHQYRSDYNNRPSNTISFIPAITSTSGSLRSEFALLLLLQVHRETDRFFAGSGVHLPNPTVVSSTTTGRCSCHRSSLRSATSSPRLHHYGSLWI